MNFLIFFLSCRTPPDDCFWNSQGIFSLNLFSLLWINLFCSIADIQCRNILKLCAEKHFLFFFNATLFSSCDIPQFRLSLLNWYFMIGNIFGQSWLIWASFHTASDHQSFPLLGIDLKNVLTKHFQKVHKQPFAFDL